MDNIIVSRYNCIKNESINTDTFNFKWKNIYNKIIKTNKCIQMELETQKQPNIQLLNDKIIAIKI